ncbi:uncharacterized protein EDB91DRAFT_1084500 [Suillus paluster]|uniref:uncharacterized protein n=1 Tax=Suillus paluster TaxID=48578 RepID=UPI001B862D11|nr:uncharacterized protein EDB91DRAFT_1084500 [Suillus paluster]KAG1733223.1 hypothetical protein EDB91DRAFT_1084500 [Suillus paluster]
MKANIDLEAPGASPVDGSSWSSTPESHEACTGYHSHGQGAPVYSYGCYNFGKVRRLACTKPSTQDPEQTCQLAHNLDTEQYKPLELESKVRNGDEKGVDKLLSNPNLKRKASDSSDEAREREFQSVAKVELEVAAILEAVHRMEAAVERQSRILVEVCNTIENNGM